MKVFSGKEIPFSCSRGGSVSWHLSVKHSSIQNGSFMYASYFLASRIHRGGNPRRRRLYTRLAGDEYRLWKYLDKTLMKLSLKAPVLCDMGMGRDWGGVFGNLFCVCWVVIGKIFNKHFCNAENKRIERGKKCHEDFRFASFLPERIKNIADFWLFGSKNPIGPNWPRRRIIRSISDGNTYFLQACRVFGTESLWLRRNRSPGPGSAQKLTYSF